MSHIVHALPPETGGSTGLAAMLSRIVHRLREAHEWRQEVDDTLALLGQAFACHRTILFHLRPMPRAGFAQSIEAYWIDLAEVGDTPRPTVISQSVLEGDALLRRIAADERQGKPFLGHTRDLDGFLRRDFERQRVRSFLSQPIFANGNLWGTIAVNDCVRDRLWSEDEIAALDLIACAIGDAIERSSSEHHVSEIFRATMTHAALDGVVVIDEAGGIIEFNPAAETMFGWRKSEVLGNDISKLLIPEEHRGGHVAGMRRYLDGGPPIMIGRRVETQAMDAHGETFPIELTISEVKAAERRFFVGSIRDLRERRRAEAEINRQRDKLHQNEKMAAMGSLLAGVSHELNNPLAVVVAQSTLLYEFASDPQVKSRAEKVRAAAERCGRIVKSFLGMVRLHDTTRAEADLNQIIRAALEVTAYGARSTGVGVETDLSPGELPILADADHVTQVAANFLVNAQHALAAVSGERRIRVRTWRADAELVGFSVEDTGPGIDPDIAPRIFEPYFTTKPVGVGTGIGLSISRSIVERHGGRIWFENAPSAGARFSVELPAIGKASAPADERGLTTGAIRRALIVDDEYDVASSLADLLELMGVKASVMTRWTGAAEALAEHAPDVVFCDLRMPEASGLTILAQIRSTAASNVRFVLVTGDMIGARAEVEAMPPSERPLLLEKPFSTLDVRGVLAAIADFG